MKKIQCLKDFENLVGKVPSEFLDYLNCEFYSLYEYLSNGEKLEDFILPNYQNMVMLEKEDEIKNLLIRTLDIEFVEEVELHQLVIFRIGINIDEDVQLYYAIKGKIYLNI